MPLIYSDDSYGIYNENADSLWLKGNNIKDYFSNKI